MMRPALCQQDDATELSDRDDAFYIELMGFFYSFVRGDFVRGDFVRVGSFGVSQKVEGVWGRS